MKAACSWSGGKDSSLACWKAITEGHDVRYLINFVAPRGGRDSFHGVSGELLTMQSEAAGIPMIQRETTWENYEQTFREVMQQLREAGIEGLITGDMDVIEHRQWVENMCSEFGFKPLLPLWGLTREEVLGGFIDNGFKAVTVCVKAEAMGGEWLGRGIDGQFMSDLQVLSQSTGVDICGENGEYHTYVFDGPLFRKRISPVYGGQRWREGYGFLQIERAELTEKVIE